MCSSGSLGLHLGVHNRVIRPGVALGIRGKPGKTSGPGCHPIKAILGKAATHIWIRIFVTTQGNSFYEERGTLQGLTVQPSPISKTSQLGQPRELQGHLVVSNQGMGLVQMGCMCVMQSLLGFQP